MPECPHCREPYVHGMILCPHCGQDLDEPITLTDTPAVTCLLPVVGVCQLPAYEEPTIILHVIHVYGDTFAEGDVHTVAIPIKRLEVPVRIGRADARQSPPILPEIDLTDLLESHQHNAEPHCVSRLHAALQLEDGLPAIKPLVEHSTSTWVRHTRVSSVLAIVRHQPWRLQHRDVIILGSPHGRRVELRVVLSHPVR